MPFHRSENDGIEEATPLSELRKYFDEYSDETGILFSVYLDGREPTPIRLEEFDHSNMTLRFAVVNEDL